MIDPIHDGNGALIGFAKVTRDVTERRQAQDLLDQARERMMQAQKMEAVGQLTGGVAHDFNNLLMVVIGNLEVAQRNVETEKRSATRLKRAIDSAMRGAQRAATLTQRLLAFSRRQPLDPKAIDLNKFVVGEVEFLQRTLGEKIHVEAVGGAGLWKVAADVNQLQAVLLNLAVNARDAMPQGGKLTIETGNAFLDEAYCRANPEVQRGQYVLIAVTDNGAGMTQDVMNRAFEPFFSTKPVGEGTGLGLSQVYGFIKQSGGHIKIYSEPGEGTTVKIYLPRIIGDASMESEDVSMEPVAGERDETILVVEDDEDVRAYLVETLHDLDYRILRAHNSAAALEFLQQGDTRIDLLLTDVVLPGMNGRELARKAQVLRSGLKVLFMTGYSRNAIVHQGRLDSDVELIQKPYPRSTFHADSDVARRQTQIECEPGQGGARSSSLSIDSRTRRRQRDPLGPPPGRRRRFHFRSIRFAAAAIAASVGGATRSGRLGGAAAAGRRSPSGRRWSSGARRRRATGSSPTGGIERPAV